MDKTKLQRKLEEQTVRDHTNMRRWRRHRMLRYESILNDPVLPRFCMICFFGMLVGTAAMVIFDIYASATYLSHLGFGHMLKNAATSGLFCWLLFAIPLIPCALYQLRKGFSDPYFQKFLLKRNGKPRMPMKTRFQMYVSVAAAGIVILTALYLLSGILS
jgi:hypothetical protein